MAIHQSRRLHRLDYIFPLEALTEMVDNQNAIYCCWFFLKHEWVCLVEKDYRYKVLNSKEYIIATFHWTE